MLQDDGTVLAAKRLHALADRHSKLGRALAGLAVDSGASRCIIDLEDKSVVEKAVPVEDGGRIEAIGSEVPVHHLVKFC